MGKFEVDDDTVFDENKPYGAVGTACAPIDGPLFIHDEGEEPETDRESNLEIQPVIQQPDGSWKETRWRFVEHGDDDNLDEETELEEFVDENGVKHNLPVEFTDEIEIDISKLDLSIEEERHKYFAIKNHKDDYMSDVIDNYKDFERLCPICYSIDSEKLEWCDNCEYYRLHQPLYFKNNVNDSQSYYVKRVKHIYLELCNDRTYERKPKTIEM